jgi:hypothetical protein
MLILTPRKCKECDELYLDWEDGVCDKCFSSNPEEEEE